MSNYGVLVTNKLLTTGDGDMQQEIKGVTNMVARSTGNRSDGSEMERRRGGDGECPLMMPGRKMWNETRKEEGEPAMVLREEEVSRLSVRGP